MGRNPLRNIAATDCLVSTGLRISELLNLNRGDLPKLDDPRWRGLKTAKMLVKGKGNKTRIIKIPKHVLRAIYFYMESDEYKPRDTVDDLTPVFLSSNGTRWSVRTVELLFERISDKTGIKLVPHGCRHTFAVYQLSALIRHMALNLKELREHGIDAYRQLVFDPLRVLQRILRHSSILSTYIYLDCLEEAEELVEESLNAWTNWTD